MFEKLTGSLPFKIIYYLFSVVFIYFLYAQNSTYKKEIDRQSQQIEKLAESGKKLIANLDRIQQATKEALDEERNIENNYKINFSKIQSMLENNYCSNDPMPDDVVKLLRE